MTSRPMTTALAIEESVDELAAAGFCRIAHPFADPSAAWCAAEVIATAVSGRQQLEVIGDFVIPPVGSHPSRDFQTLHIDFGVPLVPARSADVARFTALHISSATDSTSAATRLVGLKALMASRTWPSSGELIQRFAAYGRTHGAWDDMSGYTEGSLARIIDAAAGAGPVLPSVKADPAFLCGTEFGCLADERAFFADHELPLDGIENEVRLDPGELLIFDNLRMAHGRRGVRRPGELNQRVFGSASASVEEQIDVRNRVLAAFGS